MTRRTLEELAAAYGLGMLDQAEASQLEAQIRFDPHALDEVASFIDTAAAFAAASSPCVEPSVEQRARILANIAATPQLARQTAEKSVPDGYSIVLNNSAGWVDTEVPGFRTKLLSRGPHPGYQVMLIALAPGGKVPDHGHVGTEEIYMLSGHLDTEGQVMGPGDFLRAEAGTHHRGVVSPEGCLALLIMGPVLAAECIVSIYSSTKVPC
jgi:anti-sigma factor ChrR (cupin superfamily)